MSFKIAELEINEQRLAEMASQVQQLTTRIGELEQREREATENRRLEELQRLRAEEELHVLKRENDFGEKWIDSLQM